MIDRVVDKLVGALSPRWGLARIGARLQYRATLEEINALTGGNVQSGYDAAKLNRLLRLVTNTNENAVDFGSLDLLEARSRDLWRNNPSARKVVRQITTKTIGQGMRPISQAVRADGSPHMEFRKRVRDVWGVFVKESDSRGKPGRGGDHFTDQSKTGLAATVRGGNVLVRTRMLTEAERARHDLLLPIQVQLIDAARLDHGLTSYQGNPVFRGIEFDQDGQRVAYHVLPFHPSDPRAFHGFNRSRESTRLPAGDMVHAFVTEDVDQVLGVSWFAPALHIARDAGDYEYSELKAAAMSACVVATVKRGAGAPSFAGVAGSDSDPLEDANGNRIARLQPGMLLENVELDGFNPQRPNANAHEFMGHLLRRVASAFPGMKGSSLTNDYRRSSFASERSADNDVWPEIEAVQDFWSCSFNSVLYEQVIITAVLAGHFDGVVSPREFMDRRREFLGVKWQGPVCRSINPKDDEQAAELGRRNLTSSVQMDAARKGVEAFQVLDDLTDYVASIEGTTLPDDVKAQLISQALGCGSVVAGQAESAADEAAQTGESGGGESGGGESEDEDEADDRQRRFINRLEGLHA